MVRIYIPDVYLWNGYYEKLKKCENLLNMRGKWSILCLSRIVFINCVLKGTEYQSRSKSLLEIWIIFQFTPHTRTFKTKLTDNSLKELFFQLSTFLFQSQVHLEEPSLPFLDQHLLYRSRKVRQHLFTIYLINSALSKMQYYSLLLVYPFTHLSSLTLAYTTSYLTSLSPSVRD